MFRCIPENVSCVSVYPCQNREFALVPEIAQPDNVSSHWHRSPERNDDDDDNKDEDNNDDDNEDEYNDNEVIIIMMMAHISGKPNYYSLLVHILSMDLKTYITTYLIINCNFLRLVI